MKQNQIKFEKQIDLINEEIKKRRYKWTLSTLNWIDFEDVSQIIRFHLFKKWHLYDQTQPLLPWINRIISNQIKNLIRNYYGNYTRPCLRCLAAVGTNGCRIYKDQNSKCPMYDNWEKTKKIAYNLKMTVSMEDHEREIGELANEHPDMSAAAINLHKRMQEVLKPTEWIIYKLLYIDDKDETHVCKTLGFKYNKNSKVAYNKQLKNIQKIIIKKAKECLEDIDL